MTRKSVVARDAKRQKMVDRYASKRAALKEAFANPNNSYEEKWQHLKNYNNYLEMLAPQELQDDALLLEDLMLFTENLVSAELNYVKLQCAATFLD